MRTRVPVDHFCLVGGIGSNNCTSNDVSLFHQGRIESRGSRYGTESPGTTFLVSYISLDRFDEHPFIWALPFVKYDRTPCVDSLCQFSYDFNCKIERLRGGRFHTDVAQLFSQPRNREHVAHRKCFILRCGW